MKDSKAVQIFTDGACRGHPGPGGWGVVLRYGDVERTFFGGQQNTTNNQMELMAAIQGLEALTQACDVVLTTDSKYVIQGITEWMISWKKNGWKTSAKKPVKNVELWQRLDAATNSHKIDWQWVRGHTGHPENELADELANRGVDELEN